MTFLQQHFINIIQYDALNKYTITKINLIPVWDKIIISFNFKICSRKKLLSCLLAIKLLTGNTSTLLKSKKHNLKLKIKKGVPVSCLIILKKQKLYIFFLYFIYTLVPYAKFLSFRVKNKNSISFRIEKKVLINEFNDFYSFFKDLPDLNVTFITTSQSVSEMSFLLNSFNIKNRVKN